MRPLQTFESPQCRVKPPPLPSSPLVQRSDRLHGSSLDYEPFNKATENAKTRVEKMRTTRLRENQYWV